MMQTTGCVTTAPRVQVDLASAQLPPVTRVTLDNGMTVLVTERRGSGAVSWYAVVNVGSATETPYLGSGISHFVEHMLFKGTERRAVNTIEREIADLGGDSNGHTSFDETAYVITVPREGARQALDILADMLLHSSFAPNEVEKEREVIRNEMRRGRDDPDRQLYELLWSTAYRVHAYHHPTIGYQPVFDQLTRDDLVQFYRRYYTMDNMTLSVAGDVRIEEVVQWVQDTFGGVARSARQAAALPSEPVQLAERHRFQAYPGELTRVAVGYRSVSFTDADLYALDLLAVVLGQGDSSILVQALQYEQRLVHSIGVASVTPKDPGLWTISFAADPDRADVAITAVNEMIERVGREGVPVIAMARARQQLISDYLFGSEMDEVLARRAADGEVMAGDPNFASAYLSGIARLTVDDLRRVAGQYLKADRRTVAVLGPSAIEGAAAAARTAKLSDIARRPLPNGAVLLTRYDDQLPLVSVRVVFKGGVWGEGDLPNGVSALTARLLTRGTKRHAASEIAEAIEAIGGRLDIFSGNNSFGVTLDVPSMHIEQAAVVLHELVTEPAFDPDELEGERSRLMAAIRAADENVFQVAQRHLRRLLYPSHPYGRMAIGTVESVSQVHHNDVIRYAAAWLRPEYLVVALFGHVEPSVVERVESSFGAWDVESAPGSSMAPAPNPLSEGQRAITVEMDRAQAVAMLGFPAMPYRDPDKVSLDVLIALLSGSDGRLFDRVRQQFGLAYVVGASAVVGYDTGFLSVYAATSPSDVQRVAELLHEELARCVKEPVSPDELERVKRRVIGLHRIGLQSNGAKAMQAALDELYGVDPSYMEQYPALVERVTVEDIRRVAARCLRPEQSAAVLLTSAASGAAAP